MRANGNAYGTHRTLSSSSPDYGPFEKRRVGPVIAIKLFWGGVKNDGPRNLIPPILAPKSGSVEKKNPPDCREAAFIRSSTTRSIVSQSFVLTFSVAVSAPGRTEVELRRVIRGQAVMVVVAEVSRLRPHWNHCLHVRLLYVEILCIVNTPAATNGIRFF